MKQGGSVGVRVNFQIRVPQVRVIEDGKMLGVMETKAAITLAQSKGVDLIEIDPKGNPPTCKLMELGKYKYEMKKREQSNKQTVVETKELRIRPRTDVHDLDVKIKHARNFLEDKDKVLFVMSFQGREMEHKDLGIKVMNDIIQKLSDIGNVETPLKHEGKKIFLILGPKK
jgi:translation initiation factor IF-3